MYNSYSYSSLDLCFDYNFVCVAVEFINQIDFKGIYINCWLRFLYDHKLLFTIKIEILFFLSNVHNSLVDICIYFVALKQIIILYKYLL